MASPADERAVLDTNVLVYAMNAATEQHAACRRLHDRAVAGEIAACVTTQVLFEYFSVVTYAGQVTRMLSPTDALADVEALQVAFEILPVPADLADRVIALLRETGFSGRHVFDVQLAATMLAAGVQRIYTYDPRFEKMPGIVAVRPE